MKKLLSLIILSMLFCFSAQAEEKVYTKEEVKECTEDKNLLCDLDGSLITGYFKEYRGWEILWYETPYKNGKKDGVEKRYDSDGTLLYEIPYKNGKKDGVEKWYYSNGTLRKETPYKDGKEEGTQKLYRADSSLEKEIYYKNGKKIKEVNY